MRSLNAEHHFCITFLAQLFMSATLLHYFLPTIIHVRNAGLQHHKLLFLPALAALYLALVSDWHFCHKLNLKSDLRPFDLSDVCTKRQKDKKEKKTVLYCDVKAVLHSCDVSPNEKELTQIQNTYTKSTQFNILENWWGKGT